MVWTYVVIDFGRRLHICGLVFEHKSWEDSCDFILFVQLWKDKTGFDIENINILKMKKQLPRGFDLL